MAKVLSYLAHLQRLGQSNADAAGRAWWLVQSVSSGHIRLTQEPDVPSRETVLQVFPPRQQRRRA